MIESIDRVKINHLFSATMIGYFGNAIFPFRLGELLRAYAISKKSKIQTTTAFGTILTERLVDMAGLVLTMLFFTFLHPISFQNKQIMFILGLITLLGFIFIFLLISKKANISNYLKRRLKSLKI